MNKTSKKNEVNPKRRLTREQALNLSRAAMSRLTFALENENPPPCVGCELYEHCATHSEACQDFFRYVDKGVIGKESVNKQPNRATYLRIFSGERGT